MFRWQICRYHTKATRQFWPPCTPERRFQISKAPCVTSRYRGREYVAFNKTLYEKPEFAWLSRQRNRVASIHFSEAQAAAKEVLAGWHRNATNERKLYDADKKLAPFGHPMTRVC